MAKRRKGRTFRKKMRGGQEEEERKYSPVYSLVDISKLPEDYKKKMKPKPTSFIKPTDEPTDEPTEEDLRGGKLRRTRKRRMSKRRRNSRKSRKSKSRKMHRGGLGLGSVLDFLRKKKEKKENKGVVNMTTESNSGFENQPVEEGKINRIEEKHYKPIDEYTKEEYTRFREKPYIGDKPVDNITMKKNSWFPF